MDVRFNPLKLLSQSCFQSLTAPPGAPPTTTGLLPDEKQTHLRCFTNIEFLILR